LKAKILTHVRCHLEDAKIAVETGVDGLDVVIGTSSYLREHSHGKDMTYIKNTALEVIEFVKSKGKEIRFSSEDSFRSDLVDLLSIYSAVDKVGVNRVGIADTVGCASPRQVYDLVRTLRGVVSCDIETHFHNDSGCAIANAFCALEAGATHIDTSVLGIGERNGITPLGGLMARMIVADRDYVLSKYNIKKLKEVEDLVADLVEVNVHHRFLCLHAQGRHSRQGYSQQPVDLRDYQPSGLRHVPLRPLRQQTYWLECHQEPCGAVGNSDVGLTVQGVHGQN
jgi:homocitrate synthase